MDPSKQRLLQSEKPRRSYHDEDSDVDSDYLQKHPKATVTPTPAFLGGEQQSGLVASLKRPFKGRSRCCLLFTTTALILWAIISASGAIFYTKYSVAPPTGQSPPWYPAPRGGTVKSWADSYKKASEMVSKMTLPEKVNITTGTGWRMGLAVGTTGPAVHVGFPQLQLQDGPLGIRFADNATAWPAGITTGATFNKELFYLRGKGHATEAQ